MNRVERRERPYGCAWCGRSMLDSELGRRRKYCRRSCRQRAYEQRTLLAGTSLPDDSVILSAAEASALGDRMFALRCAAEDLDIAVSERAGHAVLAELAAEVLTLAREAEKLR